MLSSCIKTHNRSKKKRTNTVCNNIISHDGNFDMRIKFGIMDTVRNSKLPTKASLWAAPK